MGIKSDSTQDATGGDPLDSKRPPVRPWANADGIQVLSDLTHELRTPLGSILMLTELLGGDASDRLGERDQTYLLKIQQSAEDLRDLIEEVGLINRIDAGRIVPARHPISLRQLFSTIEETYRERIEAKGLVWETAFEEDLPEAVATDHDLCTKLLGYLVNSALRATERGSITLRAKRQRPSSRRDAATADVAITVQDTAPTVPEDQLSTIFAPFADPGPRNRRRFGGQSLALPIAHRLSRLLGGDLVVAKATGDPGNAFTAYLPSVPG